MCACISLGDSWAATNAPPRKMYINLAMLELLRSDRPSENN